MFKRKVVKFEIPDDARELTDEELFLVNGGSERRENSHEGVAGANVGDTIQRNDGTIVTLNQGDIDYARKQLGINGGGSGSSGGSSGSSGSGSGSGSSGGSSGSGSSGSSADTTPSVDLKKKSLSDLKRDLELLKKMFEQNNNSNPLKNIKNPVAKELLAKIYEGNNAGYIIDNEKKVIITNWNDQKALAAAMNMERILDMEILGHGAVGAGYVLSAYDEKTNDFLRFRNSSDVTNYQAFEKLGVYEDNPNGSDVYFIYTYPEDDRGMKEFERSSILDEIKYLQKKGFSVRVIEKGTKEEVLKAFSDDKAKIIITSGHGSDNGHICTYDFGKVRPVDVQELEVGESLKTVIFENCYQGDFEKQWESAFGGSIDVVGWHKKTNTVETRLFNGCGEFDRQDLNLFDYLNLSLLGGGHDF